MVLELVTIYITNYNYGHFIKDAVESVINQTYANIEIIIIDDGSTDDSKNIIEQYASQQNISVVFQQNKGLNITNNIALSLAKGVYIMRLDADDYLDSMAIEEMMNLFERDSNIGMIFPDYFLVDKEGTTIGEVKRHDFNKHVELYDQPAHGACTLINANFLRSVGGYDESYTCQDGYELWIKFISKYKVTNIQKPLFYYRQHGENLTTNENKILTTRRNINLDFIQKNKLVTPATIGIIPLRNTLVKGQPLIEKKIGQKTLLEFKVDQLLRSQKLDTLIITSHDQTILDFSRTLFEKNKRVQIIARPASTARYNVTLLETCIWVMKEANSKAEAVMFLPIEFPFVDGTLVDDAINTLTIFGADSLISVRKEKSTIYQHDGSGMKPILNQEAYTRLEREALYKNVGGILLSRINSKDTNKKMLHGKVGHIVIDQKSAHSIQTEFDLKLANFMHQI